MKVIYKVWIDHNGGTAFGEGPYQLLKGVEKTGSLWKAAAAMGMAYSKARRIMSCCEKSLGFALTYRKIGGVLGGGSGADPQGSRSYEDVRGPSGRDGGRPRRGIPEALRRAGRGPGLQDGDKEAGRETGGVKLPLHPLRHGHAGRPDAPVLRWPHAGALS